MKEKQQMVYKTEFNCFVVGEMCACDIKQTWDLSHEKINKSVEKIDRIIDECTSYSKTIGIIRPRNSKSSKIISMFSTSHKK